MKTTKSKNIHKPRNSKTEILLWNAIVVSTLTYALQTNQAGGQNAQKWDNLCSKTPDNR